MTTRSSMATMAISLACFALLTVAGTDGAEERLPRISSTPVRVALFKNGLGFVEREGHLPKGVVTGELGALPIPVHGTFWVYTKTDGVELRRVLASTVNIEVPSPERDVATMAELLDANSGRELDLLVVGADGKLEQLKGKVRVLGGSVPVATTISEFESGFTAPAVTASMPSAAWRPPAPAMPTSSGLLLVETVQGQLVIDKTAVRQVRGDNLLLQVKGPPVQQTRASLKVDVSKNDKGALLHISYLAKGITWAPSYRLELLNDKTARIYAKAQIFNDLEDLHDAQLSVIAGFPNLQFANVVDPMAFRGDIVSWLHNLTSPAPVTTRREAVMSQQVVQFNVPSGGVDVRTDFDPAAFAGRGDSDLFFYELNNISLKRGERGYFPLFTAEVPYESLYDCRIGHSKEAPGARGEEFAEDVWHALRLRNNSKQPWTTAPAMVVRDGLILGQDTLYYTSLGGQTLLRFTKALDVRVSSSEREVGRQRNVHRFESTWDLVSIEGAIHVVNLKPVEVTVIIQRTVEGEITSNPQEAKISLGHQGPTGLNPTSNLVWEIKIKPREKAELTYVYKRYVR